MTREGDGYGKVVRPNVVKVGHDLLGRRCPLRRVVSGEESWPWEASSENLVRNSKLHTVDRPIEGIPSGRCPIVLCSGEPGGMVGVEVAKLHLVSTVLQKSIKVGSQFGGQEDTVGFKH